jgi:GAF domain-containing protein
MSRAEAGQLSLMTNESYIDGEALARSLAALREHAPEMQLIDAVKQVLNATHDLFAASGAGLMMLDANSALCSVAATDERGRRLEQKQEQVGHGPCVDAVVLDQITPTRDLAQDARWPQLVPELPDAGVRAVLGIPVRLNGVAVAALNVYRSRPHTWDPSEITALTSFGGLIAGVLGAALQAHQHSRLAEQLQHALDNRVVIERAVGVIMAREQTDPVTAFNRLRGRARSSERRIVELAQELLSAVAAGPEADGASAQR